MYFIMRDVSAKLGILNDLRNPSKHDAEFCEHFKTVQSMCNYEADQYAPGSKKPKTLGSRNLLRLHRALLFIIELFDKVCNGK